jgi:hypothetical protein
MGSQFIYGSWQREVVPPSLAASNVFIDGGVAGSGGAGQGDRSPGLVRVSDITPQPTLTEHWTVLGWTVSLGLVFNVTELPYFGALGKLWAGLAMNAQQRNQGGLSVNPNPIHKVPGQAQFPADLSTFDGVWTQDDDVAIVSYDPTTQPLPASAVPALIAKTFMFPAPVDINPGSQMQMQLVLTPGVYGWANELICTSGNWSLIYDDNQGARR